MTENEAIREIKCWLNVCFGYQIAPELVQAARMATEALREVQQYRKHGITVESALNNMCDLAAAENLIEEYRAIGTPEELKAAMKYVHLAKRHETVGQVIENCVKYEEIGTLEECRKTMEKQNAVKPTVVLGIFGGTEYECKNCGNNVENGHEYCGWCGQKLDWSDVLESNGRAD